MERTLSGGMSRPICVKVRDGKARNEESFYWMTDSNWGESLKKKKKTGYMITSTLRKFSRVSTGLWERRHSFIFEKVLWKNISTKQLWIVTYGMNKVKELKTVQSFRCWWWQNCSFEKEINLVLRNWGRMDKGRGKENNCDPTAMVLSEGRKVFRRSEGEKGGNII